MIKFFVITSSTLLLYCLPAQSESLVKDYKVEWENYSQCEDGLNVQGRFFSLAEADAFSKEILKEYDYTVISEGYCN